MATITTPAKITQTSYRNNTHPRREVTTKYDRLNLVEPMPWWRSDVSNACNGPAFMAIDRGGSISGLVLDGTVPTPYAPVHLYYRISGMLISKTLCNTLGEYKFRGLDRYSSDYFAVAMFDGDNAQIYDHLTPS